MSSKVELVGVGPSGIEIRYHSLEELNLVIAEGLRNWEAHGMDWAREQALITNDGLFQLVYQLFKVQQELGRRMEEEHEEKEGADKGEGVDKDEPTDAYVPGA